MPNLEEQKMSLLYTVSEDVANVTKQKNTPTQMK